MNWNKELASYPSESAWAKDKLHHELEHIGAPYSKAVVYDLLYPRTWHNIFPSVRALRNKLHTHEDKDIISFNHRSSILAETITNHSNNTNSVAVTTLDYVRAISVLSQKETAGIEHANTLLLGSLSSDSANEMSALLEYYLPDSTLYVTDLYVNKSLKERMDDYPVIQSNALHLPYKDESFHFVATNSLMHMIEINEKSSEESITDLFSETYRVLKPGGIACFVEVIPHWIVTPHTITWIDQQAFYAQLLLQMAMFSGFKANKLFATPTSGMHSRKDIYRIYKQFAENNKVTREELERHSMLIPNSVTMILEK